MHHSHTHTHARTHTVQTRKIKKEQNIQIGFEQIFYNELCKVDLPQQFFPWTNSVQDSLEQKISKNFSHVEDSSSNKKLYKTKIRGKRMPFLKTTAFQRECPPLTWPYGPLFVGLFSWGCLFSNGAVPRHLLAPPPSWKCCASCVWLAQNGWGSGWCWCEPWLCRQSPSRQEGTWQCLQKISKKKSGNIPWAISFKIPWEEKKNLKTGKRIITALYCLYNWWSWLQNYFHKKKS